MGWDKGRPRTRWRVSPSSVEGDGIVGRAVPFPEPGYGTRFVFSMTVSVEVVLHDPSLRRVASTVQVFPIPAHGRAGRTPSIRGRARIGRSCSSLATRSQERCLGSVRHSVPTSPRRHRRESFACSHSSGAAETFPFEAREGLSFSPSVGPLPNLPSAVSGTQLAACSGWNGSHVILPLLQGGAGGERDPAPSYGMGMHPGKGTSILGPTPHVRFFERAGERERVPGGKIWIGRWRRRSFRPRVGEVGPSDGREATAATQLARGRRNSGECSSVSERFDGISWDVSPHLDVSTKPSSQRITRGRSPWERPPSPAEDIRSKTQ